MLEKRWSGRCPDDGIAAITAVIFSLSDEIKWDRIWLEPFSSIGLSAIANEDWRAELNEKAIMGCFVNHLGLPLQFVDQSDLPVDTSYESFISTTGRIPTRRNLHDFFNALVWITYPSAKAQLNQVQAAEIARMAGCTDPVSLQNPLEKKFIEPTGVAKHQVSGARGKVRDRATIFDENGAVLFTTDQRFARSLQNHEWLDCLYRRRTEFCISNEIRLFGHALMEKLVRPYKAITAHVWVIPVSQYFFSLAGTAKENEVDRLIKQHLIDDMLSHPSTPLPVLGVPGWWSQQDANFYADPKVFRPKKSTPD